MINMFLHTPHTSHLTRDTTLLTASPVTCSLTILLVFQFYFEWRILGRDGDVTQSVSGAVRWLLLQEKGRCLDTESSSSQQGEDAVLDEVPGMEPWSVEECPE